MDKKIDTKIFLPDNSKMLDKANKEGSLFFCGEIRGKNRSDMEEGNIVSVEGSIEYKENEDRYYCAVQKLVGELHK